jgi:glycosyltransferase involved in cell wall biosynthesis
MLRLKDTGIDFEINITLTKNELENSRYWDSSLNSHTNFYGYISDSETLDSLFCDNAILISTSIIETLGLHVIEAIKNGIISIVPNEEYSKDVYGNNMFFYDLHDVSSLTKTILSLIKTHNFISDKIRSQQAYLVQNEGNKFNNMQTIFDEVNNV